MERGFMNAKLQHIIYVLFHFNLCIKVITNQEKLHSCCVNKEQCKDIFMNKSCKFTSFS